jgi:hypothetical protein
VTPEVQAAIEAVNSHFPGHQIDVEPESQGGAYVTIHGVDLGERLTPSVSWIGFLLSFPYPRCDVYPFFIDQNVRRSDGSAHGGGFQPSTWQGQPAWQVSRRTTNPDPTDEMAALKVRKVLDWVRAQ